MKNKQDIKRVIKRIDNKGRLKYNTKYDNGFKKALMWVLGSSKNFNPYDKYEE